jgi:hypothetical protein
VRQQIASWQLSDFLLVEVHLRFRQDLAENPALALRRQRRPFNGMCYRWSMVDPENRLREHLFVFHVGYSQDEESVIVARGRYRRRDN